MPRKKIIKSKYFINNKNSELNNDDEEPSTSSLSSTTKKRKLTNIKSKSIKRNDISKKDVQTGTSKLNNIKSKSIKSKQNADTDDEDDDDEEGEEEDWEEVEEAKIFDPDSYEPEIPQNIKITLNDNDNDKKKKNTNSIDLIQRQFNKLRKEKQIWKHKFHLLLLIYRLQYLNSLINNHDPIIQALTISFMDLIPPINHNDDLRHNIKIINKWFRSKFNNIITIDTNNIEFNVREELIQSFETISIRYPIILNLIFISFLRMMNFMVRCCNLLNPITIKEDNNDNNNDKSITCTHVDKINPSNYVDYFWLEIFDEKYQKWLSFDIKTNRYDMPKSIFEKNSNIVSYILTIDNDNRMTDATARYVPKDWFSNQIKKRRVNEEWWKRTMDYLKYSNPINNNNPNNTEHSKYEKADQMELENIIPFIPIPDKFSLFKNHKLFALTRDLLKFQAIYPPDAPPMGFFKEEPVYSRDCVHTLRSRESWLRDARTVKLNEKPYKIVTSKFKWKKPTVPGEIPEKEMLELFGIWQTKPYEPPKAKNGIVPRNGYGNVDLYQQSMLPIGCVHLKLPGLLRIANKLNIDCVPAIVGFEGTCGGSHPVFDGFVVCEQHKDILLDAWNQEQQIQDDKEKEKKQKRIYDNWKRLIRGLMIKRKLKIKYGY